MQFYTRTAPILAEQCQERGWWMLANSIPFCTDTETSTENSLSRSDHHEELVHPALGWKCHFPIWKQRCCSCRTRETQKEILAELLFTALFIKGPEGGVKQPFSFLCTKIAFNSLGCQFWHMYRWVYSFMIQLHWRENIILCDW